MTGESGKKQADNFDTSVTNLEVVITRLRKAIISQKKANKGHEKNEETLVAQNKVLVAGLNALKTDYEILGEAFTKMKEAMEAGQSEEEASADQIKKLKDLIEEKTFDNETLKASIDFIKEEHKNLIKKVKIAEKKIVENAKGGDEELKAQLQALIMENRALKIESVEQDKHLESFARQHALGKNIKTILNKRIDATIVQLEDMLQRQEG